MLVSACLQLPALTQKCGRLTVIKLDCLNIKKTHISPSWTDSQAALLPAHIEYAAKIDVSSDPVVSRSG